MKDSIEYAIAEYFMSKRLDAKLSRKQLSDKLGIDVSVVTNYELKRTKIQTKVFLDLLVMFEPTAVVSDFICKIEFMNGMRQLGEDAAPFELFRGFPDWAPATDILTDVSKDIEKHVVASASPRPVGVDTDLITPEKTNPPEGFEWMAGSEIPEGTVVMSTGPNPENKVVINNIETEKQDGIDWD